MGWHLGIDLGTTFTAAAVCGPDGRARMVGLGDHGTAVPSVLLLTRDGTFIVGDAAVRRATDDPDRVARETKRRVGDAVPIMLGGSPYSAALLQARLLRWAVDKVTAEQGTAPAGIAVTHPASWGPYKLEELRTAIRQAEVEVTTYLPEPVAAATAYAAERELGPGATIAVYDLGGGTFDCCVVRRDEVTGAFGVVGTPEGVDRLGGIDFDEAVFDHVKRSLGGVLDGLDSDDQATVAGLAHLRRECTAAKEALSSDTTATISVLLPNVATTVRLGRAEFEAMIRPALSETITALHRTIRTAGLTPEDLDAVLLVGGSSRIPQVSQLVGAELGRPVAVDAHPKDAIALGAALAVAATAGTVLAPVTPPAPVDAPPQPPAPQPEPAPAPDPEPVVEAVVAPASEPQAVEPPPVAPPTQDVVPGPAAAARGRARWLLPAVAVVVVLGAIGAALALGGGGDGGDGDGTENVTGSGVDVSVSTEELAGEVLNEDVGHVATRTISMPDSSFLLVRGVSTEDLVVTVLGDSDDGNAVVALRDEGSAVDSGITVDMVGDAEVFETFERDLVEGDFSDISVVLSGSDNVSVGEEEILWIPFTVGFDVIVAFTNFDGADGSFDARIDIVDYDIADPEDFEALFSAIRSDGEVDRLMPELNDEFPVS